MTNALSSRLSNQTASQENAHKHALRYLSVTIFILFAFPRMRITFGPIPIYIIDIFIFLTLLYARKIERKHQLPLGGFVVYILVSAVMSEFLAGIQMGVVLQPIYIIARTILAVSLFFSVPKIIRTESDLQSILNAALPGVVITTVLMIMTSVPQTRSLVTSTIFSLDFLEPAQNATRIFDFQGEGAAARGRSLIGVSIISAAFLNAVWALLFLLRRNETRGQMSKLILNIFAVLIPIAIVMSYSRGGLVGLLLVVITVLSFSTRNVRRPVVIGVGVALIIFSWVGWNSDYFYFRRLELSTERSVENTYQDASVYERVFAYTEPFQHLVHHPLFLFVGQGFARETVPHNNLTAGRGAATHAVFAAAYYGYGMLAALAYMILLFRSMRMTLVRIRQLEGGFASAYSRALFACLMGFLSWFLLGHAAVSQPRGAMLLFLVFGLVAAQVNFAELPEPVKQRHLA